MRRTHPEHIEAGSGRRSRQEEAATSRPIAYADARPEVRAVFDATEPARGVADIDNFRKALAVHPPTLRRTRESLRVVMAPGALDPSTRELFDLAVSASNSCDYCIASHETAAEA